jgi:ABC-2 type transport system ATP-binding protein
VSIDDVEETDLSRGTGEDTQLRKVVVTAEQVSKKFRLFKERNSSLKATIVRGHRIIAEDFWALRDVSFDVREGETFGLIGENGSGKSTMLKCLTKILRPDEGRVQVDGKISALLELGAGFHPELSGRENVFLNGAILGLGQKELRRRFDDIVDFAGIGPFIDEPVKNYSSGMYIRLGFSVAINVDPDVLLVDEVLAVGDESFQRKCNEKFAELRAQGKTIVLVSHGLAGVQNLCDRVAWFQHGQLMMVGEPREVIESYVGTVQVDRETDDEGNNRWGSGEGRIVDVQLLDSAGRPTNQVRTGEAVKLRLHYEISEPIERPVFGLAFNTVEGFLVSGPNSRDVNCVPEKLEGSGYVEVTFPSLRLLPRTYDLHVSLYDYSCMHPFDFRQNVLRFDVERGPNHEQSGVAALGGKWRIGNLESEG